MFCFIDSNRFSAASFASASRFAADSFSSVKTRVARARSSARFWAASCFAEARIFSCSDLTAVSCRADSSFIKAICCAVSIFALLSAFSAASSWLRKTAALFSSSASALFASDTRFMVLRCITSAPIIIPSTAPRIPTAIVINRPPCLGLFFIIKS